MSDPSGLDPEEAVDVVAAAIRRLFGFASEAQARQVAAAVLRELETSRIRLVRYSEAELARQG